MLFLFWEETRYGPERCWRSGGLRDRLWGILAMVISGFRAPVGGQGKPWGVFARFFFVETSGLPAPVGGQGKPWGVFGRILPKTRNPLFSQRVSQEMSEEGLFLLLL